MKKNIAFVLFIAAAGLLIWWMASGHQMWTTTQHMIEVKDELFGTVTQTWEKQFTPGLELIGPAIVVLGGVGWFLLRTKKQRTTH
ncbi:MAG: hypothetical protein Q8922_12145 [Bacteroidota bacterium]|nr:hypothetical protein [Bacteroidota bacterium]MDP4233734.1 hypothetical protein [Bacteroidota bacterium]MDP4242373.1 hypothetical protein [Bacteroidota bacterium]MDP4288674.1 hypothetical protein [Bacteroidota bacterium]